MAGLQFNVATDETHYRLALIMINHNIIIIAVCLKPCNSNRDGDAEMR